jgi:hypothetical protein
VKTPLESALHPGNGIAWLHLQLHQAKSANGFFPVSLKHQSIVHPVLNEVRRVSAA